MEYLKIRKWDKWQTYRRDRNPPPWIKVHRRLANDANWASMSDAERGQLVAIWLLAADRDGVIPADANTIRKLCMMDSAPDLGKLQALGFIEECQDGVSVTPSWQPDGCQGDAPEAESESESESEKYSFAGSVIKLLPKHYDPWKANYSRLDLNAELQSLDDWLAALPEDDPKRRNWFFTVSGALKNRHNKKQPKPNGVSGPRWIDVRYDYEQKYGKDQALKRYTEDLDALVCGDDEGSKRASCQSKSPVPGV